MKTTRSLLISLLLALSCASAIQAQNTTGAGIFVPSVSIVAADREAAEARTAAGTNTALFVVSRSGPTTNGPLQVFYAVSGTASNGVDYDLLPGVVTIPQSAPAMHIVVVPREDNLVEGLENVTLRLLPVLCATNAPPTPDCYNLAPSNIATVSIYDPAINPPPQVAITAPTNNASFTRPVGIPITATAFDPNGSVQRIEILNGNMLLGNSSNSPLQMVWSNAPAGEFTLTARAFDSLGAVGFSAPVRISVRDVAPTNLPPTVSIFAPANGGTYYATSNHNVLVVFHASDPDDRVASVELFVNSNFVGLATTNLTPGSYWFIWSNVTVGTYALRARATDSRGASSWSPVSWLTILPPRNSPPSVAIVSPPHNSQFPPGTNILLAARASDSDGTMTAVEFFQGTNSLGWGTVGPWPPTNGVASNTFLLTWSNVPAGQYVLAAVATDNQSVRATSQVVSITVRSPVAQPVVTIVATDVEAVEIPPVPPGMGMPQIVNPAVFAVTRTGDLATPLDVFYQPGGTAVNGMDYEQLPGRVTIPAGTNAASIHVLVRDDLLVESNETVVLTIVPPACVAIYPPPPSCYLVGAPASATVVIFDNDTGANTNFPPTVSIVSPANGSAFISPATIGLLAQAQDRDGTVETVEFLANNNSLGVATNNPLVMSPMGPFHLTWSNVPPGEYRLTARATDSRGASSMSAPVMVSVRPKPVPVLANRFLPSYYVPGVKLLVRIQTQPPTNTASQAVADKPPTNWAIGGISDGGAADPLDGKVKFGPFADNKPRALTYELTPPANETGMKEFAGIATLEGRETIISGARLIRSAPLHPADKNPTNSIIAADELAAYEIAWKRCGAWCNSLALVPINFLTRAGFLLQSGGAYAVSTAVPTPYPPLLWVPVGFPPPPGSILDPINTAAGLWTTNPVPGRAVSTMPSNYVAGAPFTVLISLSPSSNVLAYAVEDRVPQGWAASGASDGGVFCPLTGKISWGLFLGSDVRALTYQVTPPTNATLMGCFYGTASFDGVNVPVTGQRKVVRQNAVNPPPPPVIVPLPPNGRLFNFSGQAGANYRIEVSTNLLDWMPIETLLNNDGTLQYIDASASSLPRRFYRAVQE